MPKSDEELIAIAKASSGSSTGGQAIEELFQRHYQRVALWCLRWTGDKDKAQDLAQEIFIKVHRSIDSFQGDAKFTTWLYTVARNHSINAGMSSRLRECVELDEAISATLTTPDKNPEDQASAKQEYETARQLIEQNLDETEKRVLLLHYVEGWSLPMVTRSLQLTNASGAKAYMVSGHRKLKAAVEKWKRAKSAGGAL